MKLEHKADSQLDAVPGLAARQIQSERVRVHAERFGGLQRNPLHGNGQRENRQKLSQAIMGDADHRDAGVFGSLSHFGDSCGLGSAAVEADEPVILAQCHRGPVQELLHTETFAGDIRGLADLQRSLGGGPLIDPAANAGISLNPGRSAPSTRASCAARNSAPRWLAV